MGRHRKVYHGTLISRRGRHRPPRLTVTTLLFGVGIAFLTTQGAFS